MIQHLACMMDGNRRWARKQGLATIYGHQQGVETVKTIVDFCLEKQIPYLSLYTLSIENLKRPDEENNPLFDLALKQANLLFKELQERDVRVRFIGDRSLFPQSLVRTCLELEEKTARNRALHLNFLFCYGAQQEIVQGVKQIAHKVAAGQLKEEDITVQLIHENLWMGESPAPDIVIRTGGAVRLSNFLLFQSAYSEYCFLDCLWPDLQKSDLEKVMNDFYGRKRNFGT